MKIFPVFVISVILFSTIGVGLIQEKTTITIQTSEFVYENKTGQKFDYNLEATEMPLSSDIILPSPHSVEMILEDALFRRCSLREFADDPISLEELSTLLWAACGYRGDGSKTIPSIGDALGANLYVLIKVDSTILQVYRYDALNHMLLFYKNISSFNFGQYKAPMYIGIVWDTNVTTSEFLVGAQIGTIGQNVHLMAIALQLGAVINADLAPYSFLARIKLPPNEIPRILIPIGYPKYPYDFRYRPLAISSLPKIQYSEMSLFDAIIRRNESINFGGALSEQEQSQLIWSSYGYSYLLDKTKSEFVYHINRHRTVPSAHGYYPLRIYVVSSKSIYQYINNIYDPIYGPLRIIFTFPNFPIPVISFLKNIKSGDFRDEIAHHCSQSSFTLADLIIILVLDIDRTRPEVRDDLSGEEYRWMWWYEAGAATQNVLLELAAWNLSGTLTSTMDQEAICNVLELERDLFEPLFVLPLGKTG